MPTDKKERAKILAEKLARHAASAEKIGNAAEASSFMSKVTELVDKFNLEMPSGESEDDQYITVHLSEAKWFEKKFVCELAHVYGVAAVYRKWKKFGSQKSYVTLHGKPNQIEMFKFLYSESRKPLNQAFKEARLIKYKEMLVEIGNSEQCEGFTWEELEAFVKNKMNRAYSFKEDFYTGVGIGISRAVTRARNEYQVGLNGVMKSEYYSAMQDYSKGRNVTAAKSLSIKNKDAYFAGLEASEGISAGKGLTKGAKRIGKES